MGVIAAGQRLTAARLNAATGAGEKAIKVFPTSATLSSGTYANLPGSTSLSIVKYAAGSDLRVDMKMLAFSDASSTGLRLGVQINGTDYDVSFGYFTSANVYSPVVGFAQISGLPAGTYTVQARWRRTSGAGVVNINSGISELDLSVREVGV